MDTKTTHTSPVQLTSSTSSQVAGAQVDHLVPTRHFVHHWILEDAKLASVIHSLRNYLRELANIQGDSSGTDEQLAIEAIVRLGYARTQKPTGLWNHFCFVVGWTCRCIALSASLQASISAASRNRASAA